MITNETRAYIKDQLLSEFKSKLDGGRKNVLFQECPFCGHSGYKFAVYVGPNLGSKRFGMSNCFVCQRRFGNLNKTLEALDLEELIPTETSELDDEEEPDEFTSFLDDDIDDSVREVRMPKGYKRCFKNPYLKSRGWILDDYEYFPVGTNRHFDREYANYVILEIIEDGKRVGFVARNTLSAADIDSYNSRHAFKIRRYKNSDESNGTGFAKLLYNYDAIIEDETPSVILCEGPFDVVALNRKLELYDNHSFVPVATFGKKISREQMYKLQKKGVEQVVIGYDNDAKETTSEIAKELENYFDVLIADIPDGVGKDWDEIDVEDIYDIFLDNLKTVREFNLE